MQQTPQPQNPISKSYRNRPKYYVRPNLGLRITASVLVPCQLFAATPVRSIALITAPDTQVSRSAGAQSNAHRDRPAPSRSVPRATPNCVKNSASPAASIESSARSKGEHDAIKDADIFRCHAFQEPLVTIGVETTAAENAALNGTIAAYTKRTRPDDDSAITHFLKEHPKSPWRAGLLLNLGLDYRQTGWFLKALAAFEEAWKLSKGATDPKGKALADGAIGELAELHARLGHRQRVEALLTEIKHRPLAGSATEKVALAREGAALMGEQPETSLKCGAFALNSIHRFETQLGSIDRKIIDARSTKRGMSLAQVEKLARDLKMDFIAAKRRPGAKVIVPSVINWKAGHYAAVLREQSGGFLVKDPAAGGDMLVSQAALDAESTGYFLIPSSTSLPKGWQLVSDRNAARIWGSGGTASHDPSGTKPNDDKAKDCPTSNGMAVYNFHLQTVSLNITDTPVGYEPPVGYPIRFTVTYNQREYYQPQSFNYSNLGSKWTFNWLSYVQDTSTNQSADVILYVAGGGAESYKQFNGTTHRYAPEFQSGAVLRQVSWSPIRYERALSDGSREIFERSNGATGTRKVFLTERIDSAGNSVHLNYDGNLRLTSITDALNQVTTLSYELPGDTYEITKVTDPFGRFAMFGYTNNALTSITDTIGIVSTFAYDSGTDFINTLITPYATTTFAHPPSQLTGDARIIEATDQATGETERVEFGHVGTDVIPDQDPNRPTIPNFTYDERFQNLRNSFYWDKKAWAMYPGDYTKARRTQWHHAVDTTLASNTKERTKEPLEYAVYYFYPGQPGQPVSPWFEGTTGLPSIVAQKLADGTSRVTSFQRNPLGNITQEIDPIGRTFGYTYWTYNPSDQNDPANMADVKEIRQTRSGNELLFSATYDPNQHRRLTATDVAGQTTTYSYNSFGEVLTAENPRHEITTYGYGDGSSGHPVGYLTSITGPLFNGSHPVTSFSYDAANRVRTVRNDPDGYETTTDYDDLDRPTQIAYPDGTNQQFQYTDDQRGMTLDLTASKDRLGRWTYRHYNAIRQMDQFTDPNTHITRYDWCSCGTLNAVTDANTNVTRFNRDLQGRLYQKVFADNTTLNYLYEGQTAPNTAGAGSRLKSITDSVNQVTNYLYYVDDRVSQISYTNPIHPTPTANFVYDPNYPRMTSMTDGLGLTSYTYYPITSPPVLGAGQLQNVDGPFANDTITYSYDQLGRTTGQSINGVSSSIAFDSLGRLGTSDNALGHFDRTYDGVTPRLQRLAYPNTARADYSYFGNLQDRRLQTLTNSTGYGSTTRSRFDYTYDPEGQIQTFTKNLSGVQTALSLQNDAAKQLTSVSTAIQQSIYSYDNAANRYDVKTYTGIAPQAESYYTVNNLNQLDTVSKNGAPPVPLYYDVNGNLTDDATGKTYEWDAANRLIAINYTDTDARTEIAYDGLGRMKAIGVIDTDIEFSAVIQPPNTSYTSFNAGPFSLVGGEYMLSFEGLNPNGGDNTAFVDAVTLNNMLVANGSFEVPNLGLGHYAYRPTGGTWSFVDNSGISSNGSTFTGNQPAPDGLQVAFLQTTGSISQTPSLSAGTYTLQFQAAQRANFQDSFQQFRVELRPVTPVHVISGKTFVWSGNTIAEERDTSGASVTKRFFAEGEQRIGGTDAGNYYYTRDHLGSVREATDVTGALQGQYDYDAWGNAVVVKGKMQVDFGYTGHYFHQPSGLNLAKYRAYSPNLGRWISRDPIGEAGGINLYGYVRNNPAYWIDPDGRNPIVIGAGIGTFIEPGAGTVIGAGLGAIALIIGGAALWDRLHNENQGEAQPVDGEAKPCPAKDLTPTGEPPVDVPSTKRGNEGGRSVEETYTDTEGRPVTKHTIYSPSGRIIDQHYRPGRPKYGP
jgi:RHS repeat-associated protein